jgi:hypothetical protein
MQSQYIQFVIFLDPKYLAGKKYLKSHTFIFIIETKFYKEVIKITKLYLKLSYLGTLNV